ncbi:MAG TPA: hypothetical protein VK770_12510 [Candidatus Acidoferrum sp.]|nr:hypothetical protein [Candidatus Acidoferrum sp.]
MRNLPVVWKLFGFRTALMQIGNVEKPVETELRYTVGAEDGS